jgi:hypothetical protein
MATLVSIFITLAILVPVFIAGYLSRRPPLPPVLESCYAAQCRAAGFDPLEIITPKQDFTLAKDKYDIIDSRITQRMLKMGLVQCKRCGIDRKPAAKSRTESGLCRDCLAVAPEFGRRAG